MVPLGLTAAVSASNAAIQKQIFESGTTALIISDEEIDDIVKIVESLEESGLLITGVGTTIKNEAKERKGGFLDMLLGTLCASLLENLLEDREIRGGDGVIEAGERTNSAGQDFQCCLLLQLVLKYKNITKMNPDLMVLIQEIIYVNKGWGTCN